MESEKVETTKISVPKKKQEDAFFVSESFLSSLSSFPPEVLSSIKLIKNKLFIPEAKLDQVLSSYSEWLSSSGVGSYSGEKLISRIFGNTKLVLYYLPEGNACEIGFLAQLKDEKIQNEELLKKIKLSQSVAISALDYLHPRDSSIQKIEGIEIRRPHNQSVLIELEIKNELYQIQEPLLRKVVSRMRASRKLSDLYPDIHKSLRDSLQAVRTVLRHSKKIHKSKPVLIPEKYNSNPNDFVFYISGHLVFVCKGLSIVDIYESRGVGFGDLIDSELQYLIQIKKVKSIDVFQLNSRDKKSIGSIKIAGKWFTIDKKAFRFLLEKISDSKWFRGKIDSIYTISQILEKLVLALKNADWVDVSKLGRASFENQKDQSLAKKPRFELKYTPWTFKTGKNYSIIDFVESGVLNQRHFKSNQNRTK